MNRRLITLALFAASSATAAAQSLLLTHQIGTAATDLGVAAAVDSAGNAYMAGYTYGNLAATNAGFADAYVSKFSASGTLLWTRQLGTPGYDEAWSVAADAAGNVYICGTTSGNLAGTGAGSSDAFLAKYDAAGTLLWTRQLGTSGADGAYGIAVISTNSIYISGSTSGNLAGSNAGEEDVFLAKYDAAGALVWTRQFGTPAHDYGNGIALDTAGNAYLSGATTGNLAGTNAGEEDAFLAKFDASGAQLWTRQFGTPVYDYGYGIAVDTTGNAYIAGVTLGNLAGPSAGYADAFLAKYDTSGIQVWTRQFGTADDDAGFGVTLDAAGSPYITGYTYGSLGAPNAGDDDAYIAKFTASGTLLWSEQIGASGFDEGWGAAADSLGNIYVAGLTDGSLGGPNAGNWDAFLAKFGTSCYANCDNSNLAPILNVNDFTCFINKYAAAAPYANCDASTLPPILNCNDFTCFLNRYAAGCP